MSAKQRKRPMRLLTVHEKLDAIHRVHDGQTKASVARDIGVPESTLRGWCKNEEKIAYLSTQSSPETEESLEWQNKKPRVDDYSMEPYNLCMKDNSNASYSPNSEAYNETVNTSKIEEPCQVVPLQLNINTETPKTAINHLTERVQNRVEHARLGVEPGPNRSTMFPSNLYNGQISAYWNMKLLAHWNALLLQQQQQKMQHDKNKVIENTCGNTASSSVGLLTTVDMERDKRQLPKEQQSVNEYIWYWLKYQQNQTGLNQTLPHSNGAKAMTTASTMPMNPTAALNGVDQNSWFWKWYKQVVYNQQAQQQYHTAENQILYQQLTRQREPSTPKDQQNAENLTVTPERAPNHAKTINDTKLRFVLDNMLFKNDIAVNTKDTKENEATSSQREALEHGEKFLKWLETYSDPSVTAMQIMEFKILLDKVKTGAGRKNTDAAEEQRSE